MHPGQQSQHQLKRKVVFIVVAISFKETLWIEVCERDLLIKLVDVHIQYGMLNLLGNTQGSFAHI